MARTDRTPLCERSGERRIGDVPSRWNREQRRVERTKDRRELMKIRIGASDWDDVPLRLNNNGYRRDYYW
jgi:hypothetical protein